MLFSPSTLSNLARHLTVERKRQGLTRAQAAAVCNVSSSFIRDAETDPARCSLGRLLQYMTGLGLTVEIAGWSNSADVQVDATTAALALPANNDDKGRG